MIDELLRPFEFEFFRNGLIVATIAGALCGAIGVYVVLKGMSYIGHGLSHAIFGGFAASSLLGVNYLLGAGLWGVVSALMINAVTRRRIIGSDAAIGVITTASFARMLQLATGIGAVCGFVGMNLSYHLDVQSGPTIVLVAATLFAAVFVATGVTGRRRAAAITAQSPLAAR